MSSTQSATPSSDGLRIEHQIVEKMSQIGILPDEVAQLQLQLEKINDGDLQGHPVTKIKRPETKANAATREKLTADQMEAIKNYVHTGLV